MKRREFIRLLGSAAALVGPSVVRAQQPDKPARVGFLGGASGAGGKRLIDCFRAQLSELGWVEGKNIILEYRWSEGVLERYSLLAGDLVNLRPDMVVVTSTPGTQAVKRATNEIPIVFIGVSDPVASGIVASLARPGGNVTGVSNFLPATSGKLLELLTTATPNLSRVGVIHNPTNAGKVQEMNELGAAAKTLAVVIEPLEVRASDDFDRAFLRASESKVGALITLQEGVTFANRARIVEYAAKRKLPSIFQIREFVDAGGLMSYGLNYCQHYRRGASYADKILKGARPVDLPVELPTTFELVINLKTAKALGLTIPPTLLARADELIE